MTLGRRVLVLFAVTLAVSASEGPVAQAQSSDGKLIVEFGWDGQFFLGTLPHGKEFLIAIDLPGELTFTGAFIWKASGASCTDLAGSGSRRAFHKSTEEGKDNTILVDAPDLAFSTAYCFRFLASKRLGADDLQIIEAALARLVERMAPDELYSKAKRRELLRRELGPLGTLKWRDQDGKARSVLDWLADWVESNGEFEELRDFAQDASKMQARTAQIVESLRKLDAPDVGEAFDGGAPSAVSDAMAARDTVVDISEKNRFFDARQSVLDPAASPPALNAAGQELQAAARLLDGRSRAASSAWCTHKRNGTAALDSALAPLQAAVDQLAAEIQALESGGNPDSAEIEARKAALEEKTSARDAMAARRDARQTLCKALRQQAVYGVRLGSSIDRQLEEAHENSALSQRFLARVQAESGSFPVEVLYGGTAKNPTYTERGSFYISGDVGVAFPRFSAGNFGASFYVGVSFHFGPVDKDIPLRQHDGWVQRCSMILGITVTGIHDDANTVKGVVGDQALMTGLGCRITDYLRLGAGAAVFRQVDPNPAIAREPLRMAPYVSLSVDSDVVGLIKGLVDKTKSSL